MNDSGRLCIAIKNSNLSYAKLEKITGIPSSTIQRYASASTKKIPIDSMKRLALALKVTPEYLCGFEERKDLNCYDIMHLPEGGIKISYKDFPKKYAIYTNADYDAILENNDYDKVRLDIENNNHTQQIKSDLDTLIDAAEMMSPDQLKKIIDIAKILYKDTFIE